MVKELKKMEEDGKRNGFGRKRGQKKRTHEMRREKRYRSKEMAGGFILSLMTWADPSKPVFVQ